MTTEPERVAVPPGGEGQPAAGFSARHMLVLAYLGALGTLLAGIGALLAALMR